MSLQYDVRASGHVRLAAYDLLGREVALLVDTEHTAGRYEALLDGRRLPSGVYLTRMATSDGFAQTRTFTIIR